MPLFFFEIEADGRTDSDTEGMFLDGYDTAREEAVKALHSVAADLDGGFQPWTLRSLVRNDQHQVIFAAELTFNVQRP